MKYETFITCMFSILFGVGGAYFGLNIGLNINILILIGFIMSIVGFFVGCIFVVILECKYYKK